MTRKHFIKLAKLIKDNGRMANVRNKPMFVINQAEFIDGLCDFLQQENYENLIPDFIDRNTPLDKLRGESLYQVAPELEFFRDYEH